MVSTDPTYEFWLRKVFGYISPNFSRAEPRRRAWTYIRQLTDDSTQARGCRRHLASYALERRADGAQRLLTTARWDEAAVRKDLWTLAMTHFGACGGTLYVTEAAFVKRGSKAAAVERQFSTDSRRLENCQIAVLLFCRAPTGHLLLIDSDLYIPLTWAQDPERCRQAGIPDGVRYRTKSEIAAGLIERALDTGFAPAWTSYSVECPNSSVLRRALRSVGIPHFMRLTSAEFAGLTRHQRAYRLLGAETAPDTRADPRPELRPGARPGTRWPMSVRGGDGGHVDRSAGFEVSYASYAPAHARTAEWGHYYGYARGSLSAASMSRLVSEQNQTNLEWRRTREDIRLDHYEVRSWRGWQRHMTLAMVVNTAMELASLKPARAERPATLAARPITADAWQASDRESVVPRQARPPAAEWIRSVDSERAAARTS
jgi:hypothetical protein